MAVVKLSLAFNLVFSACFVLNCRISWTKRRDKLLIAIFAFCDYMVKAHSALKFTKKPPISPLRALPKAILLNMNKCTAFFPYIRRLEPIPAFPHTSLTQAIQTC